MRTSSHGSRSVQLRVIAIAQSVAIASIGLLFFSSEARAQPHATLQLPTFSSFSISTSVLVPDQGSTSLGGVGRAYQGSSSYGPPGLPLNRAFGGGAGLSSMSVHAWIHDLHALDESVLSQAGPLSADAAKKVDPLVARYGKALSTADNAAGDKSRAPAVESLATIRARRADQKATEENKKAKEHFATAMHYEESGKTSLAKMYYRMAGRTAKGELRDEIVKRLRGLEVKPSRYPKPKADED